MHPADTQRGRKNLALLLVLVALVGLFYALTIVKLGSSV